MSEQTNKQKDKKAKRQNEKKTKIQNDIKQRDKKTKKEFNNAMLRQFHTLEMFLRKCIHSTIAWNKSNFAMDATLHF